MTRDNQPIDQVAALLHTARTLLLDAKASGARRRRLKNIESAVMDAIGAVARQGLTVDESQAAAARLRGD